MIRRPAGEYAPDPDEPRATYREVFAVAEFRALWFAQLASVAGDQLARVALAVLVFDRTGSAGLSAVTYALTFLPDVVGGPLLSGVADRFSRRRVMVVCDVARMGLVAAMAIPGTPLWLLCVLLFIVQLFASPFQAARAALLPGILTDDRYVVASSVSNVTAQAAQLAGFVAGGTLVSVLGTSRTLLVDAGTFAVSGLLVWLGVRDHELSAAEAKRPGWLASVAAGARLVWNDRRLRYLVALACVSGFYITVEGLAAPYAEAVGGGPFAVGILLAANPAGQVIGMLLLTRQQPAVRLRLMGWLAIGSCLPLIGCAWHPGLWSTVALWLVSGLCSSYQLAANASFVQSIPDAQRGQAFGLARTALIVSQGIGVLTAGAAADRWQPATVVAAAGILGVAVAAGAARGYHRAQHAGSRV
jgi:MFS family permease